MVKANEASTRQQRGRSDLAEKFDSGELLPQERKTMLGKARLQLRRDDSEKLEVDVLELLNSIHGKKHPGTIRAMEKLARTWWLQGRRDDSEKLEVEILELQKSMHGKKHPDTIEAMENLASTWRSQGRLDEAEQLYVEVLELQKMVLGEKDFATIRTMEYVASINRQQGRLHDAEKLYVELLELGKGMPGKKHWAMTEPANIWREQSHWNFVEELQVAILELRKRIFGENHPATIMANGELEFTLNVIEELRQMDQSSRGFIEERQPDEQHESGPSRKQERGTTSPEFRKRTINNKEARQSSTVPQPGVAGTLPVAQLPPSMGPQTPTFPIDQPFRGLVEGQQPDETLILETSVSAATNSFLFSTLKARVMTFAAQLEIIEAPLLKDYVRVWWICRCGHRSYDDYPRTNPEAFDDFLLRLKTHGSVVSTSWSDVCPFEWRQLARNLGRNLKNRHIRLNRLFRSSITHANTLQSAAASMPNGDLVDKSITQKLMAVPSILARIFRSAGGGGEVAVFPTTNGKPEARPPRDPSYLLLCINGKRHSTKLEHMEITDVKSDSQLFTNIRKTYGVNAISHMLSFRSLRAIRFVEFTLRKKFLVDCIRPNVVPPTSRTEYDFCPRPVQHLPPLGTRYLMHLFEFPEDGDDAYICLYQFPKKQKDRLQWSSSPSPESNIGWGIYFVEDLDLAKVYAVILIMMAFGSLVFGILYWYFERDIQGAFTVASYITSLLSLLMGAWQAWMFLQISAGPEPMHGQANSRNNDSVRIENEPSWPPAVLITGQSHPTSNTQVP